MDHVLGAEGRRLFHQLLSQAVELDVDEPLKRKHRLEVLGLMRLPKPVALVGELGDLLPEGLTPGNFLARLLPLLRLILRSLPRRLPIGRCSPRAHNCRWAVEP